MAKKSYTLIVVPDHESPVKRYRVQKSLFLQVGGGLLLLAGLALGATLHYFQVARDAAENRILREENLTLRSQLKSVRERIEHIGSTLDRVERFDQKLRAITLLSDPQRNLAMGPVEPEPGVGVPTAETQFTELASMESPKALTGKLDRLSAEATRQEQSLHELQAYFQDQKSLLASTPSLWPTRGWVTSDFGSRMDPYTADRVMHAGMDIAAPHGKDVFAPSDGTVVFAGLEGGYGNVIVVDHGYGIKTRYGHLAKILVKAGDRVKRGALIAAVGNTGRSTGPHLHYEVRVNGIPQNPRKFILEE
ncbi:M23 family metallopeptidase [Archangium lansingense]|uniref:M23 family metallopeptidase n=1 Tax=Archangium lansingense TaxID=2995310 RepID=A0ABT4AFH3_9BACT|nr:M23 family metallopeptidase [Archangium lansinium]MCY1080428.1 M23 family metallopeptidase [Archangium lansinium]